MSLFSGQGPVFWANRNATTGDPINYNWFGNAPEFTLGLATDTLTHKESYTGNRTTDARIITETLGTEALAGFFCGGEIGPVGGKAFLHGFTATLAVFLEP